MRVVVNFMERPEGWSVHCITEDCTTSISPILRVRGGFAAVLKLLRYVGATEEEIAEVHSKANARGRGSVLIALKPDRKNLLRIFPKSS